jgi:hypothetical protein
MTELQSSIEAADEHAGTAHRSRAMTASGDREESRARTPHAAAFRTLTGGLIGLAIAAIAVAVVIASGGRSGGGRGSSAPWSDWVPPESGNLGARDIADHIAPMYRLSAVNQLAVVTVVNLTQQSTTATANAAAGTTQTTTPTGLQVAVKPDPTSNAVSLLPGNTIAFNLCGIASQNCSIGLGTPSSARLLLLRREALELALYTFKYIGGTDNVVAMLPPGRTQATSKLTKTPPSSSSTAAPASKPLNIAVLFSRQELSFLLKQPLDVALPEQAPPLVSKMTSAPEAGLVAQVTANGLFSSRLEQAQDGSSLIVLDPLPPQ